MYSPGSTVQHALPGNIGGFARKGLLFGAIQF
jgi:hypothetical protein